MPVLTLRDGVDLAYDDVGQGPVLLLVHGWGISGTLFRDQQAGLKDRFRVITPDLRGHGDSDAGAGAAMSIEGLAEDLTELMEALDLKDVLAVGWSLGAVVVWTAMLGRARPRFAGLAIVDMAPRIVSDGGWKLGVKNGYDSSMAPLLQAAMKADWPAYARHLSTAVIAEGSQDEKPALTDFIAAEAARNKPEPLAELWGSLTQQDFREKLGGFDLPVLVAYGARSQLYGPETAADLASRFPDARRVAFEHSGHSPHLEEPDVFNATIAEFAQAVFDNQRQ